MIIKELSLEQKDVLKSLEMIYRDFGLNPATFYKDNPSLYDRMLEVFAKDGIPPQKKQITSMLKDFCHKFQASGIVNKKNQNTNTDMEDHICELTNKVGALLDVTDDLLQDVKNSLSETEIRKEIKRLEEAQKKLDTDLEAFLSQKITHNGETFTLRELKNNIFLFVKIFPKVDKLSHTPLDTLREFNELTLKEYMIKTEGMKNLRAIYETQIRAIQTKGGVVQAASKTVMNAASGIIAIEEARKTQQFMGQISDPENELELIESMDQKLGLVKK
jgi:hypothetical protein